MFRRILACIALASAALVTVPHVVNAEPAGGVTSGTTNKMGLIAAGDGFTCAIVNGGQVACWGRGNSGSIGDGNFYDHAYMQLVSGISTATQIAAGSTHVCAVRSEEHTSELQSH